MLSKEDVDCVCLRGETAAAFLITLFSLVPFRKEEVLMRGFSPKKTQQQQKKQKKPLAINKKYIIKYKKKKKYNKNCDWAVLNTKLFRMVSGILFNKQEIGLL